MRHWIPKIVYDAKPWVLVGLGAAATLGATAWSLAEGRWTVVRSLSCFGGAALAIVGGATLQMRQDYRARSKWRRERRP